jgi:hypothetical protein
MGLLWWLGALCVLVLSTLWGGETVVEKNIRKFEVSSLEGMDLTGLSLLSNGWHESLPTKCAAHGAKKGPCGLGFCKGCPCGDNGCAEKQGLGRGMLGKPAVPKGGQPEIILPFRAGVPEEGM